MLADAARAHCLLAVLGFRSQCRAVGIVVCGVRKIQAAVGDNAHPFLRVPCVLKSGTKMTDGGMRAVADMAADHPSLEQLHLYGEACTLC